MINHTMQFISREVLTMVQKIVIMDYLPTTDTKMVSK